MSRLLFLNLDGHLWETLWMDPVAVEKGPDQFLADQERV